MDRSSHKHRDQDHRHDSFAELFEYRDVARKRLIVSLSITLTVMVIEIAGGLFTGSIALLSDAGHMFTHSFAIGIGLAAVLIARMPASHHRTFGLYRAEVLAAFINGIMLLLVVGLILFEAIQRIISPGDINAVQMLGIALIGLAVNIASILILRTGFRKNLNIRSVFYHLLGDAASSVGIVIAAVIIFYTGWSILDPLISIGISVLILIWAVSILRESGRILMEMPPRGMDVETIENELKKEFPSITRIEKVHLWAITNDMLVFSAHIALDEKGGDDCCKSVFPEISDFLFHRFNIIETTIQRSDQNGG